MTIGPKPFDNTHRLRHFIQVATGRGRLEALNDGETPVRQPFLPGRKNDELRPVSRPIEHLHDHDHPFRRASAQHPDHQAEIQRAVVGSENGGDCKNTAFFKCHIRGLLLKERLKTVVRRHGEAAMGREYRKAHATALIVQAFEQVGLFHLFSRGRRPLRRLQ